MFKFNRMINAWLLKMSLRKRLQVLYIFCALIPLFLTDGVVLYSLITHESQENTYEMKNVANSVGYNLSKVFERAVTTTNNLFLDSELETFLNKTYSTDYEFIEAHQELLHNSYISRIVGFEISNLTIYADNNTILSGGRFGRLDKIINTEWYREFCESGQEIKPIFIYDDENIFVERERKIMLIRKFSEKTEAKCEKVIKVEIDYSRMIRDIFNNQYDAVVYVCKDGNILMSNQGNNKIGKPFEQFDKSKKVGYEHTINLYGEEIQIYVLDKTNATVSVLAENGILILLLIVFNLGLPYVMMRQIENSVTHRIFSLEEVFKSVDSEELVRIKNIEGDDEISTLMRCYNQMAEQKNELVQTIYKNKLKQQEMDIARQKAELLALHSQINPHFLFNTLESIRMHSILRDEGETADMIGKLAVLQRQYVEWGNDEIEIRRETEFIRAYLDLQKYRFGDRLNYSIEVEPECEERLVPKLTIVTFVENACVHGLENKAAKGWIFVRVYEENRQLCIEVEDTGKGMTESDTKALQKIMEEAEMESLKEKGRVGVKNACLRLKMYMDNQVEFHIESEPDIGTMIQIRIKYKN